MDAKQSLAFALVVAFFVLLAALSTGCSSILVKDCEQQGESQYYHCRRVMMAR